MTDETPPKRFQVRTATVEDIDSIVSLFQEHHLAENASPVRTLSEALKSEIEAIRDATTLALVAIHEEQIVGAGLATCNQALTLTVPPELEAFLSHLVVAPDFRLLGVARAIVRGITRELKVRGVAAACSAHQPENMGAAKALDAAGFDYIDTSDPSGRKLHDPTTSVLRRRELRGKDLLQSTTTLSISHLGKTLSLEGHPNDYITKSIAKTESFYELPVLETLRTNFPTHGTIIDIGANIGNHALYFAHFLKPTRLICFEPFLDSFELLQRNLGDRAELHQIALGDTTGTCTFKIYPKNLGMCDIIVDQPGSTEMRTLDSFHFDNVTLIKMDVENFHMQTLSGAMETIRRCRPVILAEVDLYDVFPLLQREQYLCAGYWHLGSRNLLFVPTEVVHATESGIKIVEAEPDEEEPENS